MERRIYTRQSPTIIPKIMQLATMACKAATGRCRQWKMRNKSNPATEIGQQETSHQPSQSSKCQAGNANTTLYVGLWNKVRSKLLPNITEHLQTFLYTTQPIMRIVLKARNGQLYSTIWSPFGKRHTFRELGTTTFNAGPLCSLEQSGSHLLGGCRHRDMVKSYIEGHNESGRRILKATTDTRGSDVIMADINTP